MNAAHDRFLQILRCAVSGQKTALADADAADVMRLSMVHGVLPFLSSAVSDLPKSWRSAALALTTDQIRRDVIGYNALSQMRSSGIDFLLLKGAVCASAYPDPVLRMASDLDIYTFGRNAEASAFLRSHGFAPEHDDDDEMSLLHPGTGAHIELHSRLIDKPNAAFLLPTEPFREIMVYGLSFQTLGERDSLLYILYHMYRHFLSGGFGVKQITDACLYASKMPSIVDERFFASLAAIRAEGLARAVFGAGEIAFGIESVCAYTPEPARALLEDALRAGVYGAAEPDRKQTARLTQYAVRGSSGIRQSLFPEADYMKKKYPFLKKRPYLLPVAYVRRLASYGVDVAKRRKSPAAAARTADERLKLIEMLGLTEN